MAWFRVRLSQEEQRVVGEERRSHPHEPTPRKMETLWLLYHGLTRQEVATIVGVSLSTVNRSVKAYPDGGLDGLRRWGMTGRRSSLEPHRALLADSLRQRPGSTVAEAADRIEQLTGVRLGLSQARSFLKKLGLRWQRIAPIPAAQKSIEEDLAKQQRFVADELKPRLDAAVAGQGHVFFVDAAHLVFGTFLCSLGSFGRRRDANGATSCGLAMR